jgi:type I restriction enzyme S subunit
MTTIIKKKLPALRFPEFTGEWEEHELGNVASFSKGKGISKADIDNNGILECVTYGELYTSYGELIDEVNSYTNLKPDNLILSEANDVIIPASGETHIDIATASCVLRSGIALGGDLNIIKSKSYGVFLSYYLNNARKTQIARLAQGSSVIHLYSSQLKLLRLNLPSLPEQQKIASFLSTIDTRIQQLTRKKALLVQYKKGVMQQIFSRQIRFKDDQGRDFPEWEEKRLGEIGTTYNGLSGKTKEHFGEGRPYVSYKQIFDNSKIDTNRFGFVEIAQGEKQNRVRYGDVFFTTSSETPNEVGFSSVLLEQVDELYLNSFCFGYRPKSFEVLRPDFARFLFRSQYVRKLVAKLAQGSTRYNMSKTELMKIKVLLPVEYEQQKIASFLSALDVKIDQVAKQLAQMQTFKKGLLQQMFV